MTEWEQARREFECSHPQRALRCKVASNGAETYVSQCLRCGAQLEVFKKRDVDTRTAAPFDRALQERWWQQVRARQEELRRAKVDDMRTAYSAYRTTPAWQAKRLAVLKRANWVCEGCGKQRATIAHHLAYARVGHEMLFDLVAVCRECHDQIHGAGDGPTEPSNDPFERKGSVG